MHVGLLYPRPMCLRAHPPTQAEAAVAEAVAYLPGMAMAGLAKAMGVPSAEAAALQLQREPMFCMETGGQGLVGGWALL